MYLEQELPASDRRERGFTSAIGLNWTRIAQGGWSANASIAQVYFSDTQPDFSISSGLNGGRSDFLLAGQIRTRNGFSFSGRALIDGIDGINKAAARAGWNNKTIWLDGSYIWLGPDVAEDRIETLSEFAVDTRYRFSQHWTGLFDWRFDVANSSTANAGVGLEYRNECVKVDFTVSRRFTQSITVQPSTSVSVSVQLLGFSTNGSDKSYDRTCSQ